MLSATAWPPDQVINPSPSRYVFKSFRAYQQYWLTLRLVANETYPSLDHNDIASTCFLLVQIVASL